MGYLAPLLSMFRTVRRLAPRQAWVLALVFYFAAASIVSISAPAFAAGPPTAEATQHEHHGHGDAHERQAPCDHGQDCDCHGMTAPAQCCASGAAAAAIWATAVPLPPFEAARCGEAVGAPAVRAAVDPPTPPPRSALS
jgi:hypothetical protein